jgi:hypothetical protein
VQVLQHLDKLPGRCQAQFVPRTILNSLSDLCLNKVGGRQISTTLGSFVALKFVQLYLKYF